MASNMISYLEQKHVDEMELRRQELQLSWEQFELERKEREAKLEEEKEERKLMRELLRSVLANNTK